MTLGDKIALAVMLVIFALQMAAMLWFGDLWMRANAANRGPDGVFQSGDEGIYYDDE